MILLAQFVAKAPRPLEVVADDRVSGSMVVQPAGERHRIDGQFGPDASLDVVAKPNLDLLHPLTGPVYLVAGGAGGFPDLNAVISGGGVTIKLVGSILIKGTRTTSTFVRPDGNSPRNS